ncbi:flagellar protein FlaG [Congregibacter litoralis]|uniref:Putative flagellar protein FlaG n=1 Tax=Congregibacter litoralis KT71 TaxID=314285 RepID=A4A605_9GAMM|nr:flagellar protein FlaG [Congregibacter litoralis]EAQ98452.2 putative flagellar protein FlaG [Congregibacter litoralis KT71]
MANPITTAAPIPNTGTTAPRAESKPAAAPTGISAPSSTLQVDRQAVAASGNSAPAAQAQKQSAQELAQATQDISEYIQTVSRSLQISVDGDLGATVIKVLDTDTDEVVRQIPAEEILQIARFIADQQASADAAAPVKGLLMDSES